MREPSIKLLSVFLQRLTFFGEKIKKLKKILRLLVKKSVRRYSEVRIILLTLGGKNG